MISPNEKIRIGIIGCGFIANEKHMPGLSNLEDVELAAFCDLIIEKAEKAKSQYGTPDAKVYTDYKELLADDTIDVVHVCTPNRSHSFITVDALEAGKHVMCEKPMAINSAEAKKMLDAAKRTGKKLTIGYQNRQRPDTQRMKKEAMKGTFGEIYYARAIATRRRGAPDWGVFLNEYEQGGGPLIDIGTHSLDLTLWMMDNYKPKCCLGSVFHKLSKTYEIGGIKPEDFTVEDSAFGLVIMENGAAISVESAWAINMMDTIEAFTMFSGTKAGGDLYGGVRINYIENGEKKIDCLAYDDLQKELDELNNVKISNTIDEEFEATREARQWIDAIRNDTDPCVLPEQAYCVTRILEGIYESGKNGTVYTFNNDEE